MNNRIRHGLLFWVCGNLHMSNSVADFIEGTFRVISNSAVD